ncbi:HNH endonuclease signature motif containing protein [Parafrankia sp. FMc6]|uniref:HNH endonuclease n=1 Tax=Parafrankia soli TaxID=2599596 RepID=UPI0034D73EED
MAISDHDRKVLWARAHNTCAICKKPLVVDGDATSRESVVGHEAHIVAQSPTGPRGAQLPRDAIDRLDNLILLCPNDHKIVDDQPGIYPADHLRKIKENHEKWAAGRFGADPIRVRRDLKEPPLVLMRLLVTGGDAWEVIEGSQAYRFGNLADGAADPELCDLADDFLDLARDTAEVSREITDHGQRAIREASRALSAELVQLREKGVVVFGGRRKLLLTGGGGAPMTWREAVLQASLASEGLPDSWHGLIK